MNPYTKPARLPSSSGFSLVEFMVAITVSLIILAALTSTFVSNSRARTELDRSNQQIENGRYAISVMADDLNLAGYVGTFDIATALSPGGAMTFPTVKPRPCEALLDDTVDGNPPIGLVAAMPMHIQGYDNVADTDADGIANIEVFDDDGDGVEDFDCLGALSVADVRPDTDILVIRRTSTATCDPSAAGCPDLAGAPYFQASLCLAEVSDPGTPYPPLSYRFDIPGGGSAFNRTTRLCNATDPAVVRRYVVHIYFIANNDQPGDGIPTLKRLELRRAEATEATVADADEFEVFSLANGIENLQIEYGIDCGVGGVCNFDAPDATTRDGAPDFSTANPDTFDLANTATVPPVPLADCAANNAALAGCMENWRDVVSVKISILARNPAPSPGYVNDKIYTLGLNQVGAAQCARDTDGDGTCEVFPDSFRRHVYQSVVRLVNPATRRE